MKHTDAELLTYGRAELTAFRADKRDLMAYIHDDTGQHNTGRQRIVAQAIRDVIRAQDERRNAAGLTRDEAAKACILAAAGGAP